MCFLQPHIRVKFVALSGDESVDAIEAPRRSKKVKENTAEARQI